ncbi:MAG: ribonuclease P protein component 4 [Promethearchaeota archaeon]
MGRNRANRRKMAREIGRERIEILMNLAKEAMEKGDTELSRRYVYITRRVAMRIQKQLEWKYRRLICRKCNSYLVPGRNARVRNSGNKKNAHVVVSCIHCGNVKRYHYKR